MLPRPRLVLPLLVAMTAMLPDVSAQLSAPASLLKPVLEADGSAGFKAMQSLGYTPLFNGKDLSGWRNPYPHGEAKVVDGEIHLTGNDKFFLVTEKQYTDFRVSVEIHLPEGPANSGVMVRCHVDPTEKKAVFGYQAECDGSDRRWSGGLYDEARRGWIWPSTPGRSEEVFLLHEEKSKEAFAQPAIRDALNRNGWNRFVITCIEDRISIEVNGVNTVDFRDKTDAAGYIGIQHHGEDGQTYRFRNLFIKELPIVPASKTVDLTNQSPVSIEKIDDSVTLVDFGKVAFGNLSLRNPETGPYTGTIHFGEKLKEGRIDRNPPGTVRYGASKLNAGSGGQGTSIVAAPVHPRNIEQTGSKGSHPPAALTPESWQPVMPFRWVEIEGWPGELKAEDITRRAAFAKRWNEDASSFECSDPVLNQIYGLCKYSIKATTFAGVYVDGDRERIPYEADAYLNQLSHYATDDHVEMAAVTFDWLMENGTWPTEWAPHMVFMAHAEWMDKGDVDWLSARYELLKTKTLLQRSATDGLVRSGKLDQTKNDIVDWPKGERDGFVFTEINTVVNAFHIEAMKRMAELARAVGKEADAKAFQDRVAVAKAAFQKTLFDPHSGLYRDGIGTDHSSVHANFIPLAFGLVPDENVQGVVAWLREREMGCSVYAAQYLLDALFAYGAEAKAVDLIVADGDRSWKHMLDSGTTISWEAWDLKYKPNQDWNHAWGAAPANLLPRHILGAQPAEAGWTTVTIRPCPAGLTFAKGKVPTALGPIEIDWTNESSFQLDLKLPEGMAAKVNLPATHGSSGVWVGGEQVDATRAKGRWLLKQEITGSNRIEVK
ncbi:family 78 glycoside hydrolase catalytic domain [Novipirellula artificiosorum]|uniref:alpha-L-rhamnosidase n=1 Tax=Novipirellula artificiosorum TaxID=2528016 RepID=A0A5C6DCF1_9BACT|nr:family 78 glycoside hydrolase catalytic domain [Novipirellula artificiosorum]TWU34348.1 Bacterial alpha-L-rhamnosidase [Novipirellula artificiosorum]